MIFFAIVTFVCSLALSLAVIVPLTGVLVRFRANYNPKGLQLDSEGVVQPPHTGPVVSFLGMFKRVYMLEGWAGLYKGFMPTFLSTMVIIAVMLLALGSFRSRHGPYNPPDTGVLGTLFYAIFMMLISLPVYIITYRSITTPYRLPFLGPLLSVRVLLTPTERRRPWVLYLTPGLMAAQIIHIGYAVLVIGSVRRLILPDLPETRIPKAKDFTPLRIGLFLLLLIMSTAILTPLEVISTRLAIQRNHSSAEYNSVAQEEDGDAEPCADYGGAEEVIGLRSELDPYVGIVDCGRKIVSEEGWGALYRAWWLTMLGALGGAFS